MNEEELVLGIQERREETFEFMVKQYTPLLWVAASVILTAKEDVEECISDVFADLIMMTSSTVTW